MFLLLEGILHKEEQSATKNVVHAHGTYHRNRQRFIHTLQNSRSRPMARLLRGAGLEQVLSQPMLVACEVLMRRGSCLGTQSAEVLPYVLSTTVNT